MRFFVIALLAAVTGTLSAQTTQMQLAKALVGTTITPTVDIAYAGKASSDSYENNKPGKCPVKTEIYNDTTEKVLTEKFGLRQIALSTHDSFPKGTHFTVNKVDVHSYDVQLSLTPVPATGEDACVRLMMGDVRLSNPADQILEDMKDMLAGQKPRKRDGKTEVEVDMNVLAPVGPSTFTKGDVTIEIVPDTEPGEPALEDHLEPYSPGLKQMLLGGGCNGSGTSTNHDKYFTQTEVPGKYVVAKGNATDGGFVIKLTNNSSHSINGESVLLTSKVNGHSQKLVVYGDGVIPGSQMIPLAVSALHHPFFPNDSGSDRVYVQFPGKEDAARHSIDILGTPVDVIVADLPTKFDPAGNPTQRDTFVFHFKVENKHTTTRVKIPPPTVICKAGQTN